MNVLILTPDRVGSTLLQRVLTIYMLRREFDKPVINLHELTNGITEYYNTTLEQLVLGKPSGDQGWGYWQALPELTTLLSKANHYITGRVAHYHIVNRQDAIKDQLEFYDYLNKNFYIISCRRENLFEHALSWCIQAHSKKLNVYSAQEKIKTFVDIYRSGITVTKEGLLTYLEKYKKYTEWCSDYFNVQSYFNYEVDSVNLEKYILGLDFMQGHQNNSWEDMFGQTFDEFNAYHRLVPNQMLLKTSRLQLGNSADTTSTYPDVVEIKNFLAEKNATYTTTQTQINRLITDGFMVSGVPIKLQTLAEKKFIVKNFNDALMWYNEWAVNNSTGPTYTLEQLDAISTAEETAVSTILQLANTQ